MTILHVNKALDDRELAINTDHIIWIAKETEQSYCVVMTTAGIVSVKEKFSVLCDYFTHMKK